MKKKIVALCLVVAMAAVAVIGGTMAYFTDKDDATNVFTVGKVDITLVEDFKPDTAKLIPGVDINKDVSIKLEKGSEPSYVWYEWLIPAALDSTDGSTGTNNIVHVNSKGSTWDKYREVEDYWEEGQKEALSIEKTWDHTMTGTTEGFVGKETIDGIDYNKYVSLYHGVLTNEAENGVINNETTIGMTNVYLDTKVDYKDGKYTYNGQPIEGYDLNNGVKIIVRAYGIQAAGFKDVYEAYTAYKNQK